MLVFPLFEAAVGSSGYPLAGITIIGVQEERPKPTIEVKKLAENEHEHAISSSGSCDELESGPAGRSCPEDPSEP